MSENLASRVGRIVSGSLNALIDAMEHAAPEIVMEEAIRDIDSAISDVRGELGRLLAGKHIANNRLMEENRKHDELAEQILLAVQNDRDDLAEAGIAQQIDIEAQIPVLEQNITEAAEKEKELESFIVALQAKKREMRKDLKRISESRNAELLVGSSGTPGSGGSRQDVLDKVAKAESAFDRIMEKQTGLSSGSSATDATQAGKLADLEKLAHEHRVKERLAALKAG